MPHLDRRLPPLLTLVPFEAAHRHRSFTRAAAELHLSQASISRRIRELEADLGVQLFERQRYDVVPTSDGDALAMSVRLALAELATAADEARAASAADDAITIVASTTLAVTLVTPLLGPFQHDHPGVTVRVIASCDPIDRLREPFDLALHYQRDDMPGFTTDHIADEAIFAVCAPSIADRLADQPTVEELASLPLLHADDDEPTWPTWQSLLEIGSPADRGEFSGPYSLCLEMAARGEGLALAWQRSVQARIDTGELVRLDAPSVAATGAIVVHRPATAAPRDVVADVVAGIRTLV